MARVSIILIYYRVIPYLRPAVRSLLDQTWRDLEVILVDNGTGAGLAPLGEDANDPRVRLVSLSTNLGYSRGFSAGLAQCSGEFVSMMGIDDIALPARIEKQVALLRVEPRLGVVSSLAKMIDEHGTIMGSEFALVEERDHFVFTAYSTSAPSPTYTCRRAVFEQFPFRIHIRRTGLSLRSQRSTKSSSLLTMTVSSLRARSQITGSSALCKPTSNICFAW